jgi:hypothetical protein
MRASGTRAGGHAGTRDARRRVAANGVLMALVLTGLSAAMSGCRPAQTPRDAAPAETAAANSSPKSLAGPWADPLGESRPDALPDTVRDLAGRSWTLHASTRGESESRGLALIFFLQDCPIANSYAPLIERLHQQFAGRSVPLLVVQADPRASLEVLREHARAHGWTVPVVADPRHELVRAARATAAPQAIVWDARGRVVYSGRIDDQFVEWGKKRPEPTRHDLRDVLERLADGLDVAATTTPVVGCYLKDLRAIPAPPTP